MPPVWAGQGAPMEDKPCDSPPHPPRLFLPPVLKAAAWGESAFRLSLAWAQALAAQPPAERLWLGASTSGLNYMNLSHLRLSSQLC